MAPRGSTPRVFLHLQGLKLPRDCSGLTGARMAHRTRTKRTCPGFQSERRPVKNLNHELRTALGEAEKSRGHLYIRKGGETKSEWEARVGKPFLPGLPHPGGHPPQIVIDLLLPDEALKSLFEIDFEEFDAQSFAWDRKRREWSDRAMVGARVEEQAAPGIANGCPGRGGTRRA